MAAVVVTVVMTVKLSSDENDDRGHEINDIATATAEDDDDDDDND